jgi:outer membrane protein
MTLFAIALSAFGLLTFSDAEATFSERLRAETHVAGGLTASEAAERAEATSGDVAARRAEVDAAEATAAQSRLAYLPRLAGSARYTRLSSIEAPLLGVWLAAPTAPVGPLPAGTPVINLPMRFPVFLDQTTFQATLAVPVSDYLLRIAPTHAAALHIEDAARFAQQGTRQRTVLGAKILYYEWARARLSRVVEDARLDQVRGHLQDARKALAAGSANLADVLRVAAQEAEAEQAVVRARTLASALEARLRTVMHVDDRAPLAIGEAIESDVVFTLESRDLERLTREAEAARPELRGVGANIDALASQARATAGSAMPTLALFGEITDANPNLRNFPGPDRFSTTWSLTAQLTWSPNDTASSIEAYRALRARENAAVFQRRALRDDLRSEIARSLEAVDDAMSGQLTAARAVASAEESHRVRRALFQNGRAVSVELTDAETELTRARLAFIGAHVDARLAVLQLTHALGR